MASFVLFFFPLDVLDEIWDLIDSVSEGFLTYSSAISSNETGSHDSVCVLGSTMFAMLLSGEVYFFSSFFYSFFYSFGCL